MKKMNKKGFTLIELLAVIVVLAIILVITVPMILNTLGNTRKDAISASANSTADFYRGQLQLKALGKDRGEAKFLTDIEYSNETGFEGQIKDIGPRCITSDEATILGLDETEYSIGSDTDDGKCNYSSFAYNASTKIVTVNLIGKDGGEFEGLSATGKK